MDEGPRPAVLPGGACGGLYKVQPEDFLVREVLPFAPEGEGEHVYLHVHKRQHNTLELQQSLARLAGIARHHVGYAGLKDRQAVTSQWFSVHLPGSAEPDWSQLEQQGIAIERVGRHPRKLRPGSHSGNQFSLVLRNIDGGEEQLEARLQQIALHGFANYFGEQRFGRDGSNLIDASELGAVRKGRFSNRQAMALSAARALLFNSVLARRETLGCWNQLLPGDLVNLDGSNSFFGPLDSFAAIEPLQERLDSLEIHPTGPMAGVDEMAVCAEVLELEQAVFAEYPRALGVVQRLQAKAARRPLRARAGELAWNWLGQSTLGLQVTLGRGVYATSLLGALGDFRQGVSRADREQSTSTHDA